MNNSKRGFAGKVSLFVGLMPFLLFAQSDYSYQPYPVLLVHGFNSTPKASWGIKTAKNENDERKISTAVALTDFEEPFSDEDAGNIARDLVNQFNNISGWKRPSSGLPSHRRFLPFEEEASYYDINHTFAEYYCAYYSVESNDDVGVAIPEFGINDRSDYDISDGGQEQLLRIRIIQVLNEYYGDFQWVNDPSAKIKLVGHSNGGAVITYMLQNEAKKDWYNDGKNKQGISWDEIPADGTYKIDGYGFDLRDHVDQVITLNSPFNGTPFGASNNIFLASDLSVIMFLALSGGIAAMSTQMFFEGEYLQGAFMALWSATVVVGVERLFKTLVFQGANNPLFKDDAPGSDLMKKIQNGGIAPQYSNSTYIPYVNYVSSTQGWGITVDLVALVPTAFAAVMYTRLSGVHGAVGNLQYDLRKNTEMACN